MKTRLLLRSLNTFLEMLRERGWLLKWLAAALGLACAAGPLYARGPEKAMSQYVRERWGSERGFPSGPVYAIAQTADGYLWIGTAEGLVRFDGLNFQLFSRANTAGPAGAVLGLTADSENNLWVRLQGAHLLRYHDGKFDDASSGFERPEVAVTAMGKGKDGTAIFAGLRNGTFRYTAGRFLKFAPMPSLPNFLVISVAEMTDGRILLGTRDTGLFQFSGGQISAGPTELRDRKINCLLPSDKEELWIGTDNGLTRWNGKELVNTSIPSALMNAQILAIGKDRQSNTWVGTAEGLFRIDSAGVSSRDEEHRGPGGGVTAIFEDREGNVWTGSTQGLERFRDSAFTTYSVAEGLPSESNGPLYVDSEGRTWFGPSEGGLYWLKEGLVGRANRAGLEKDVVYSITGGRGELWLGRQRGGLTHLQYRAGALTSETYTQPQGLAQNSVYAVHQSRDGAVWAATLSGGVSRLKDGKFSTYTTANGLLSNTVVSIAEKSDGTMWFATPKGLSVLSNDRWQDFTQKDGLPSENVSCLLEDSLGTLWLGTAGGLASIRAGSVWAPEEVPHSLREPIFGIEEDRNGGLWIATASRVLRVDRDKLSRGKLGNGDLREYGLADGLRGTEGVKRNRSVVADQLGRIWFSMNNGISFIDPARAAGSPVPALIHIEELSADGTAINLQGAVRIPAAHQRVTFRYAGLSLSVPERVRFKYKLEGFDRDWSEPGTAREATYTNLDSGSYRFRLMASNSDGLWNSSESIVQLKIDPVLWQTWWFRLSGALLLALAILISFRLRVLRLTRQMNMRFEERLAERTRIAQELHDTLLQGLLSASMQLHVADDQLADDSPAKPLVNRVLTLMGQVIVEGRNAVRGLRSSKRGSPDLEQAFSQIRQEFPVHSEFRVIVEGTPRPLRAAIRDEVYGIGREALVNAFRHSHASDVEVELEYAASHLRVLVRDNGSGIDPHIARSGREGHWGLSGMRERAERIGARFRVLSGASAGTEVEMSIPGTIAYEFSPSSRPGGWFSKLRPSRLEEHEVKVQSGGPK
jgi:signal transduction histidine kinase/ligand-binding sensor domain-containing protein